MTMPQCHYRSKSAGTIYAHKLCKWSTLSVSWSISIQLCSTWNNATTDIQTVM